MDATAFGRILERVVNELPGARGAVFVDWEGEAVDQFSHMSHTGIRLVGAHWGIIYHQVKMALGKLTLGGPRELVLSFQRQYVVVRRVTDEYLVIITMARETNLGRALHLLDWAQGKLREEM